ncbi:NAD(P)H-dependent oxidoreductase [Secundilactobacillus mixtipabuli]|uniref:NADPH-quinone reductase n=1 Tax=Secundilactobacillus mixtipabuli TaxID=1435342 RepID=A0A1Z5I961_9LACO|nr:NAD(P)H-dependent oxidoreductase [Secundilactobacillus mixtipabuli]GAW98131.1 NADPH-quinone reductase [Secundilactobacillus mixtipabuli]
MRILLINGYTPHPDAGGKLTQTLVDISREKLSPQNEVKVTAITTYKASEEADKFRWADLILLYFPLYWYAIPWGLKRYIDDVFALHQFYDTDENGQPVALMPGKQFGYVTTLAAVADTYAPGNPLTEGLTVSDLLRPLTVTFRYVGIEPATHFHNCIFYDVYNPNVIQPIKASLLAELSKLDDE